MPCYPAHPGSSPGLFFIFFLLQIAVQSAGQSVRNTSNPRCYSFRCGDVEIGYPLWNSSEARGSYCGYPNLGIDCEGGYPVLKLGGDTYRVSDVRYNTSTITLLDKDLLDSECPRATHNLTLHEGVRLEETEADGYLLFFFNCSGALQHLDEYKLPCLSRSGSSNDSYVFLEGSIPPESYPWGRCQDFVMSPVLTAEIPRSVKNLSSSFGTVLHQGFQLKWLQPNMANCISCEKAGGSCGYAYDKDVEGLDFLCFCNDGAHPQDCNGGDKFESCEAYRIVC